MIQETKVIVEKVETPSLSSTDKVVRVGGSTVGGIVVGGALGSAVGGAFGTAAGPVGSGIGAVVGGIVGLAVSVSDVISSRHPQSVRPENRK